MSALIDVDYIAERVEFTEDCWIWILAPNKNGYGVIRGRQAHLVIWELLVGPVPDGLELDHLCRNKRCVNPDHLEPVTHRVNMHRSPGIAAKVAQTECVNGHAYTPENTRIDPNGTRHCRTCHRDRERRAYPRKKRVV